MNHGSVRTWGEMAREDPSIGVHLTEHQSFVARHTIALRIAMLSEELARQVKEDGYAISSAQYELRTNLRDLMDLHEELS